MVELDLKRKDPWYLALSLNTHVMRVLQYVEAEAIVIPIDSLKVK